MKKTYYQDRVFYMENLKNNNKSFIKNILYVFVIVVITLLLSSLKEEEVDIKTDRNFNEVSLFSADKITCKYPQTLYASFIGGVISHELPKPETNPIIFSFSNFKNSNEAEMSYIDATQTITTVPLIKVTDDDEKIVFIEISPSYLILHTIYKETGVSTYAKNISLVGNPVATLSMGDCVGL